MSGLAVVVALLAGAGVLLIVDALAWRGRPAPVRERRMGRLERRLADAGLSGLRPGAVRLLAVASGALGAVTALAATGLPVAALVGGGVAALIPSRVVARRASNRRRMLRQAWPDAIGLVVGAVRSGDSLQQAMALVGERGPAELAGAFRNFDTARRGHGDVSRALAGLRRELADPTADRVCAALALARETGGREVGRVLATLETFLRADLALRSEIEARQSWVITSARVAAAAPWLVLALLGTRPGTLAVFATPTGTMVILIGAGLTLAGYRLMLRLARIDAEAA